MTNASTLYWHTLPNGTVQCDLCPHHCRIQKEDQRGLCYNRGRENNSIVLYNYGQTSGIAVDPIEKKSLYHFLPGTKILSFGTVGCNLTCQFCQNWSLSKTRSQERLLEALSPEEIVKMAHRYDCKSIAYTYNEPIIFLEFARDVSFVAHQNGLKTVAVTAGYINPTPRKDFFSFIDATNIDLKSFNPQFYRHYSSAELNIVLDTLCYVKHKTKVWLEITNLLIPGKNDSEKEITQMVRWIVQELGTDTPLHFSAFHPDWKMLDVPRTPLETLQMAYTLAKEQGIEHVHLGNIPIIKQQ